MCIRDRIYPCTDTATQVYLGVAVTDNVNPAYQPQRNFPVEVTVAMEGYMICNLSLIHISKIKSGIGTDIEFQITYNF